MQSSTLYKNKKPLIVYLIPAFVFMIVFLYYPFIRNIFNSFMKIQGLGTAATGLNEPWYTNYVRLFKDPLIKVALKNTNDGSYYCCTTWYSTFSCIIS